MGSQWSFLWKDHFAKQYKQTIGSQWDEGSKSLWLCEQKLAMSTNSYGYCIHLGHIIDFVHGSIDPPSLHGNAHICLGLYVLISEIHSDTVVEKPSDCYTGLYPCY